MKKTIFLLIVNLLTGCSSDKQSTEGLPCIDVTNNYPEKEIILTDIADVTYVHLSTENENFLYKGGIDYVTENTIVVNDKISGGVLFFSKDGTPKSRFNHYGKGPQEYMFKGFAQNKSIYQLLYDEKLNEVFIYMPFGDIIQIYTSTGEYLRTLKLPYGRNNIRYNIYNDKSLIISEERSFYLISRTNGEILENIDIPTGEANLTVKEVIKSGATFYLRMECARMVNCVDGYYLCNPESDTIYLYNKDKKLTPVLCKTPLIKNLNPMIALDNCWDTGKYQFMRVHTRHASYHLTEFPEYPDTPEYPDQYYLRDKKSGEVFRQKIIIPDYRDKEIFIAPVPDYFFHKKSTSIHFELNLFELKEAYKENRLSGKLKDLVAALDEYTDNNIFMIVDFK